MPDTDRAALSKSDLNPFLFADIGVEANGSRLTMLSMLARLEKDPWAQAAIWSRSPRQAAIDGLAAAIARMPLDREAIGAARSTASRLILLLPRELLAVERLAAGRTAGTPGRRTLSPDRSRHVFIGLCVVFWLGLALSAAWRFEAAHSSAHAGRANVSENAR